MRIALNRRLARPSALRVPCDFITQDDVPIVASTTYCQNAFLRHRNKHSASIDSEGQGENVSDESPRRPSNENGVRIRRTNSNQLVDKSWQGIRHFPVPSPNLPPTQPAKGADSGSLDAPRSLEQQSLDKRCRESRKVETSSNPISAGFVAKSGGANFETARTSRRDALTGIFQEEARDTLTEVSQEKESLESPHLDKWPPMIRKCESTKGSTPEDWHLRRLQYLQRVKGERGVYEEWKRFMGSRIDLPVLGQEAAALWNSYLTHNEILEEVISYALDLKTRTGLYYEQLYFTVVKHKLISNPRAVYHWHKKLWFPFSPPDGTMKRLAITATRSRETLKQFRGIYLLCNQRDIYNTITTELLNKRMYYFAHDWHAFLIRHNDLPVKPSNAALQWQSVSSAKAEALEESYPKSDPIPRRRTNFNRETMYDMIRDAQGEEPKKFSDHWCARLFATKAFSTQLVINGLNMFGVEEIGPLALRELAVRARTPEKVLDKFEMLRNAGIYPVQSVFTQAIHRFAKDNRKEWLDWLLTTDMHPDSFQDPTVQNEFLHHHIMRNDWEAVQRTLALVTLFHNHPRIQDWNKLICALALTKNLPMIQNVVENMRLYRVRFTEDSMAAIQQHVLRRRTRSHAPVTRVEHNVDDLRLVTNIWRYIVESGGSFDLRRWREIFRRYGMALRVREAARLANWLVTWYSPGQSRTAYAANPHFLRGDRIPSIEDVAAVSDVSTHHPKHPLRTIFDSAQQGSILAWGFQFGLRYRHRAIHAPHEWLRGLKLLKTLKERGVYVDEGFVRRKLKQNLLALHGRDQKRFYIRKWGSGFSRRRSVRWMRTHNQNANNDLASMIELANEIWGRPLLESGAEPWWPVESKRQRTPIRQTNTRTTRQKRKSGK